MKIGFRDANPYVAALIVLAILAFVLWRIVFG